METKPTPEHEWLMQLVGEWTFESSCVMGPDQEPMTGSGREVVRAIGDLWVQAEMTGEMPGAGEMTALMTLGYDPMRERFIGNWIGSPMAHMFVYEGQRSGDRLALDTLGPSFEDPTKMAKYQDVVELRGPDERALRSHLVGENGEWVEFMSAVFKRVD
ncbi:MAG: DUF1579 domain-containing protein [Phycisphaerales bacterium]